MRLNNLFEVTTADNGLLALEKVSNKPVCYYDLILMDINMPIMDGFEAADKITQFLNRHVNTDSSKKDCRYHSKKSFSSYDVGGKNDKLLTETNNELPGLYLKLSN